MPAVEAAVLQTDISRDRPLWAEVESDAGAVEMVASHRNRDAAADVERAWQELERVAVAHSEAIAVLELDRKLPLPVPRLDPSRAVWGALGPARPITGRSVDQRPLIRPIVLAETKDRFRLNVSLPIAFDGLGRLEVDLLCAAARVAVELDGAQHLMDPVAYRRDRRKDQVYRRMATWCCAFLPKT